MSLDNYENNVFINFPFDSNYRPIFDAIVFAIIEADFTPRCAMEADDSGVNRFTKITEIIKECKYSIHDISCTESTKVQEEWLPRFNMPLELGLCLGSKAYGDEQQQNKISLILDRNPYRYRTFISDLSGHDIHSHDNRPEIAIKEICKWLTTASKREGLRGGNFVFKRFKQFKRNLRAIYRDRNKTPDEVPFVEFCGIVINWLQAEMVKRSRRIT